MAGPLVTITGASSGIGLALAHAFARDGNALLLIARHMKMPQDLPADRTICAEADVANYGALEKAIRNAEAKFGKTACLVNSAGLADAREFKAVEPQAFAHEIDVNLKGVLNGTKVVLADMSARGRVRIAIKGTARIASSAEISDPHRSSKPVVAAQATAPSQDRSA